MKISEEQILDSLFNGYVYLNIQRGVFINHNINRIPNLSGYNSIYQTFYVNETNLNINNITIKDYDGFINIIKKILNKYINKELHINLSR